MSIHMLARAAATVAAVLLASVAGTPALAAPVAGPTQIQVVQNTQSMTVTGFDNAVAARAGNKITQEGAYSVLRDAKGIQIARIPTSKGAAVPTGGVQPQNAVYGNCGSSFFYLYDLSGDAFAIRTGFQVKTTAIAYGWSTFTRGQNSWQVDDFSTENGGPIASYSWSSGYVRTTQDTAAGTYYYGRVTSGWTLLWTGEVCTSGYPNDGKYLYL